MDGTGHYDVTFRIAICLASERNVVVGEGKFSFEVGVADREKLQQRLAVHSQNAGSNTYWIARGAVEALSLVRDPTAIPYLMKLFKIKKGEYALEALARFPKEKAAQEAIAAALKSDRSSDVADALGVFAEWKFLVPTKDLSEVMHRGNSQVRIAAIEYVRAINTDEYLRLARPYVSDRDPEVAKAARETGHTLGPPPEPQPTDE